jgi:ribosomal protein S18 acetylase RimI-like enzyme
VKSPLFEKSAGEPISVRCDIDILDAHRGELFGKVNAYMGDDIVGYVQFSEAGNPYADGLQEGDEVPSEIWIKYVWVKEDLRRRGIGTAMYKKLAEEFPGEKITSSGTTDKGGPFRKSLLERGVITAASIFFRTK